ncbi:hypothetical protein K7X08_009552 [Anisodus acutangulus]|uniref:SHSP domain-containing protein n=1 Tax=Anisodus acutangulus TaxID=402998 RepID=A0A9Q1N143_9SOLA|nr:hypothetical protein K7X08_009552 [Anisodus acutangulus]
MRPRDGGVGRPNNRPNRAPRAAVQPVYEDFRPVSERHQEEEAEKLLIYLPGFMKENIRVSTEGKNTMRIRGERFVGGNKWNRFQEDFEAPDDCNMRGIHAKFENGIVIITMPWKLPKQLLDEPTKQTPLTTPPTPHKDDNVPPKTTYPTIETPRKPTPLKPTAQLPKPQNVDKDRDSKGVKENKQRDEKKVLEGLVGSIKPKIQKSKEENLDQNRTQLDKSGKEVEKEESHEAGGKKVAEKSKDLREEFQEKVEQIGSKERESTSNIAFGTSSYPGSEFSFGNWKKSLAGLNEERQLLVNAGAAALVFMALGAYVCHSIGSGRAE